MILALFRRLSGVITVGLFSLSSFDALAENMMPRIIQVEGKTITAQFDLSHLNQDCGLRIKWGDGADQKIRIGRDVDENDFSLTHVYSNSGGFIFEVEGSTIKKGLGTVFGCQGESFRKAICIGK